MHFARRTHILLMNERDKREDNKKKEEEKKRIHKTNQKQKSNQRIGMCAMQFI